MRDTLGDVVRVVVANVRYLGARRHKTCRNGRSAPALSKTRRQRAICSRCSYVSLSCSFLCFCVGFLCSWPRMAQAAAISTMSSPSALLSTAPAPDLVSPRKSRGFMDPHCPKFPWFLLPDLRRDGNDLIPHVRKSHLPEALVEASTSALEDVTCRR